jgi:phosphohistidine phosphatase
MDEMDQRALVVLRHAKAQRPDDRDDIDRPLTGRGHADAGAAGAWLVAHGYRPDLVICSPAKRTRQTWRAVAVTLAGGPESVVRYEAALYEAGVSTILDLVRATGPEFGTLLLIGHNPTVSMLSALLDPGTGQGFDGLRTSELAVHIWGGSWADCRPRTARLAGRYTARG